ncbi:hypothetical protein Q9S36_00605 [Microbacterium sp. ARD31]|uniref:hypothetical protein n=1 Tax=Microbacterium sp. ARD31 TaxID=2962576 RepID=UPI0028829840|nr:hypothetical protein [Microbacterium sp. ARD31]MDT0178720.1 hypothetical protein [Microbacterium sp. ARD31]
MTARRSAALLAATALAAALTACAPASAPTPSPTPTGFASEEEAFAAAEATYRAYVDALNQVDLSDPATFEPVYALLEGEAADAARRSFSQMHADGWRVEGDSRPTLVQTAEYANEQVSLAVCVDVSDVRVLDANGESVVNDRPEVQSLTVLADSDPRKSTKAVITKFSARSDGPAC